MDLEKEIEKIGSIEIEGVKVESGSYTLLFVKDDNFVTEHLNYLPATYAYYAVLCNKAEAELGKINDQYKLWRSQAYQLTLAELKKTSKPNINEVENEIDIKQTQEVDTWKLKIEKATSDFKTLKVLVNAWLMKKDTLCEYARSVRKAPEDDLAVYGPKRGNTGIEPEGFVKGEIGDLGKTLK